MNSRMHRVRKSPAWLVCIIGILGLLGGSVALADTYTAKASITILPGELVLEIPDINGMAFDFGQQPLAYEAATVYSENGPHRLTVEDARSNPSPWELQVSMEMFVTSNASFSGTVQLRNPSGKQTIPNLTKADPVEITSGEGTEVVMYTQGAGQGVFDTEWLGEDVALYIPAGQITNIRTGDYTATLTWAFNTAL